jgi:DNA primase
VLAAARPLAEVLWQSEVAARAIDTPERRADLERRLMRAAELIAERSVQGEYRRFLRERLFRLGRPAALKTNQAGGRRGTVPLSVPAEGPPPPPPQGSGRRNREIFLGIFVHWPQLIDEWIEEIAALPVPEPQLDSLRRAILEIPNAHPGLDASGTRQHLALCGHAEILDALAISIAQHAGFASRGGDDPDVIRRGLRETLQLLDASGPKESPASVAADPSDEDLLRLTALKERELQDGPIGGIDS